MKELIEQAKKRLIELQTEDDYEEAHIEADDILCSLLTEFGAGDVVKEYHKIGKRHA